VTASLYYSVGCCSPARTVQVRSLCYIFSMFSKDIRVIRHIPDYSLGCYQNIKLNHLSALLCSQTESVTCDRAVNVSFSFAVSMDSGFQLSVSFVLFMVQKP
jgi:hypothetical protein